MQKEINLFEVLLWIVWIAVIFECSSAENEKFPKFKDVTIQIFEKGFPDVGKILENSMGNKNGDSGIVDFAADMLEIAPPSLNVFGKILKNSVKLFDEESQLMNELAKAIVKVAEQSPIVANMNVIKAKLETALESTNELKEYITPTDTSENKRNRRRNHYTKEQTEEKLNENSNIISRINIIKSSLSDMLNLFSNKGFKKYPLVTAPLLIEVATLVVVFERMKKEIIENIESLGLNIDDKISCTAHDLLLAYRERAVYARTEKLTTKYVECNFVAETLLKPYNPQGYSGNNDILHCKVGCEEPYEPYGEKYCYDLCYNQAIIELTSGPGISCPNKCNEIGLDRYANCIGDSLGPNNYTITDDTTSYQIPIPYWHLAGDTKANIHSCFADYVELLRYRVEKLFPVKHLNSLCHRKPRKTSNLDGNFD